MSIQSFNIGPVPCDEDCAQMGRPDYEARSRRECRVFQRMLARLHPVPEGARLKVRSFTHEFGVYREVCVDYEDEDPAAREYALMLEGETPPEWDAIARYELLWLECREYFFYAVARGGIGSDDIPAQYRSEDFPALPANQTFQELCAMFPL